VTSPLTRPLTRPRALPTAPPARSLPTALPARPRRPVLLGQAGRFLLVGGVATLVDVAAFNALHYGLGVGPLSSKVVATVLGGATAFVGNRQWSFDGARGGSWRRQAYAFLLVNLASMLLALLPLAVARYVLGLTGVVALNVAGNVIGLVLATGLRFWGYRRWVFAAPEPAREEPEPASYERLAA
jgi:putative flippase GtrA